MTGGSGPCLLKNSSASGMMSFGLLARGGILMVSSKQLTSTGAKPVWIGTWLAVTVGFEIGCEHLLNRWLEGVRPAQDQGAVVGQVDPTARVTTGRKTPAEILAEDQLRGMAGGEVTAVHGNELTGGAC